MCEESIVSEFMFLQKVILKRKRLQRFLLAVVEPMHKTTFVFHLDMSGVKRSTGRLISSCNEVQQQIIWGG